MLYNGSGKQPRYSQGCDLWLFRRTGWPRVQAFQNVATRLRCGTWTGDVMRVETSGASKQTVRQDRLTEGGDVMRVETSGASKQTAQQGRLTERGDIMRVETSGASEQTARQERLTERGVAASRKMAQTDSSNMQKYKGLINSVAREKNVQAGIIAGIISRESCAGADLIQGWDDDGNCFGLMQVAKEWHTPIGGWDSKEHLSQATGTLVHMINTIQKKFPKWTREQQLKGGIAAYNCGPRRVSDYDDVDRHTISGDYSNDVVARAQWYQQNW
ncbi:lysozyme g-like [Lissotriton helveticus]